MVEKGGDCFVLCWEVELVEMTEALEVEIKGEKESKFLAGAPE